MPRATLLTISASMAKPSRRLKKLLMGAVWWYLQNPTAPGWAQPPQGGLCKPPGAGA